MEVDNNYASRGLAGTALGLGAGSAGVLTAQLLANGGLNGLFGGKAAAPACSEDHLVDRYTLEQERKISELQSQLSLRDSNVYQDQKALEMYRYIDSKMEGANAQWCQQSVINAQLSATINCLQNQIAALQGLTKIVIPGTNICPEMMPRYNSFTAPTTGVAATG